MSYIVIEIARNSVIKAELSWVFVLIRLKLKALQNNCVIIVKINIISMKYQVISGDITECTVI